MSPFACPHTARSLREGWRHAFALLVLAACPMAYAESVNDPTVPPAVWIAAENAKSDGTKPASVASKSGRLVVLGKTRRLAVIDGKVIKAGEQYNGSRVVAVQRDKVLTEDESRSLLIAPNVKKSAPNRQLEPKKAVVLPAVAAPAVTGETHAKP